MPPKGRSSSSRSSSSRSRSSSRSSSSRSSSRSSSSRNRSSSSRPSSRSYSSSSYSSKSYNYGGSPNYNNRNEQIEKEISKKRKAKVFALNYKRPVRQVSSFIENKSSVLMCQLIKHLFCSWDRV